MAVPSRAFVGILVFGLIATLAVLPYTVLVMSGYQPPPQTPYEALFPEPSDTTAGAKLALTLASAFCLAVVVAAWRGLVHGARLDRELRARRAQRQAEPAGPATGPGSPAAQGARPAKPAKVEEQPPGYQ